MDSNSDRIEEAEAPIVEEPEAVIFTDEGVTDDNVNVFADLLNVIERAPDKTRRLNQAYAAVKQIAYSEYDPEIEARRGHYERLAGAFATIREYWDYVPAGLHNCPLSTVSTELINTVDWEDSPASYRRVMTALLQAPEKRNGTAAD